MLIVLSVVPKWQIRSVNEAFEAYAIYLKNHVCLILKTKPGIFTNNVRFVQNI